MKTTLDEMQVFVAVVDSGSITAAADSLGQTVSAISRALGRLEEKLEVTLLRRTTRRLELTEEGQVFLAQACKSRMSTMFRLPKKHRTTVWAKEYSQRKRLLFS